MCANRLFRALTGCALLAVLLAACTEEPPAPPVPLLREGEKCERDDQCETALCASVPREPSPICRRPCKGGCREGEVCTPLSIGTSDRRAGCVTELPGLCSPCESDADCPYPADACILVGGQSVCGRDSSVDAQCPSDYECLGAELANGGTVPHQCIPTSRSCGCMLSTVGRTRPCAVENEHGTCTGEEECLPSLQFGACDARTPAAESCNTVDDDCDGTVDEDLAVQSCGKGACLNHVVGCMNGQVPVCLPLENCADPTDTECASGTPVNPLTDPANCGSCKNTCPAPAHGKAVCELGACTYACETGWFDCNGLFSDGCESTTPCQSCSEPWQDCNGRKADGCESNRMSDPANCHRCGNPCPAPAHALPHCASGSCGYDCEPGWYDCNGPAGADGCESSTPCGGGCVEPWRDCNDSTADGCETNVLTSAAHCSECRKACPVPAHAAATCANGGCGYECLSGWYDCNGPAAGDGCESSAACSSCSDVWRDCDDNPANGCETNVETNELHCGACKAPCPVPAHSEATCSDGDCGYTCLDPWQDCANGASDGCESNRLTDADHCGSCTNSCSAQANASTRCLDGFCGYSCLTPWQDCNGTAAGDGCESNRQSDPLHCGSCAGTCPVPDHSSATCTTGGCGFQCLSPFEDCNGSATDGCEANTQTSATHCGGCNKPCSAALNADASCSSGDCAYRCKLGWADCDGTGGCELDIDDHPAPPQCTVDEDLDNVMGDAASSVGPLGTYGDWTMRVLVQETVSGLFSKHLGATITLESPPGADYDLHVYTSCPDSGASATSGGIGGTETVYTCNCDRLGEVDDYYVIIEVAYRSGTSCDNWALTVTGNTEGGGCGCR